MDGGYGLVPREAAIVAGVTAFPGLRWRAMEITTLVGSAAALASVSSFLPQAWKVIRTRDTGSISTAMYALTVTGFALWIGYGVLLGQWPLIVPNTICLAAAAFILAMKLLPAPTKHAVADVIEEKVAGKPTAPPG